MTPAMTPPQSGQTCVRFASCADFKHLWNHHDLVLGAPSTPQSCQLGGGGVCLL